MPLATTITIALGALLLGGGVGAGAAWKVRDGKAQAELQAATAGADVVEQSAALVDSVQALQVLEGELVGQLGDAGRLRAVCGDATADTVPDPVGCMALQVCQQALSDEAEVSAECGALVNEWITVQRWQRCEAAADDTARARCYQLGRERK